MIGIDHLDTSLLFNSNPITAQWPNFKLSEDYTMMYYTLNIPTFALKDMTGSLRYDTDQTPKKPQEVFSVSTLLGVSGFIEKRIVI